MFEITLKVETSDNADIKNQSDAQALAERCTVTLMEDEWIANHVRNATVVSVKPIAAGPGA